MTTKKKKISVLDVSPEEIAAVEEKTKNGEILSPFDLDIILKKTAKEMREYADSKKALKDGGPIAHVSDILGMDSTALNGYLFTSYTLFKKTDVNPYISYTAALVHALTIGYFLGKLRKEKNG